MKNKIFFLLIAFLLFCSSIIGYIMSNFYENPYMSVEEKLVNQVLSESSEIIEKKYNITVCGSGSAMPGRVIKKFTLSLCSTNSFSKQEIRKILIGSADILLNAITRNQEILQYLEESPPTLDAVQIIIFNFDKNRRDLSDPEISTGEISGKKLTYLTIDPDDDFRFKNEYNETYEEALRLIRSSY